LPSQCRLARIDGISRAFAFQEKFLVDTADGGNDMLILAIVLAIDSIHDERRERDRNDRGIVGGLGGLIGGNFP